jgi:predicted dehydrogenase
MKALVVGAGSIGQRHARNLARLGHEVVAVDVSPAALEAVRDVAVTTHGSLDEALATAASWDRPAAAFVCTYSNDHVTSALACARAGLHLFVEKPLALSMEGVDELTAESDARGLVTMVGCNMRFHPAIVALRARLDGLGRPLWADLEFGYYLPFAKPEGKASYMANRALGGSLIFDDIHELDLATWLVGDAAEVLCTRAILGDVVVDTEDSVDMLVRFASGATGRVHMDYLQHGYSRRCKIVCEAGTAYWDFASRRVGVVSAEAPAWEWQPLEAEIIDDQMYVDEVEHFTRSVAEGRPTMNPLGGSLAALRLALAADHSAVTGSWEEV